MTKPEDFYCKYFMQLRGECDTIRCEMNRFLYFALLVLLGVGIAVAKDGIGSAAGEGGNGGSLLHKLTALAMEIATLFIMTSLFWLRRLHLQQLVDRWYILQDIAHRRVDIPDTEKLHEDVATGRIKHDKKAYLSQEWTLNFALAVPVYGLIILKCRGGGGPFSFVDAVICAGIIIGHLVISYCLLRGCVRLKNPLDRKESDAKKTKPAGLVGRLRRVIRCMRAEG